MAYTAAIYSYEPVKKKCEFVLRTGTLNGNILSISDGVNAKKQLRSYDISKCKDPYSSIYCFTDMTVMVYAPEVFAFAIDFGDASLKTPGLAVGVALFGVHSELKRDEWMGKIQNIIRANNGPGIGQQLAQLLPQHFGPEDEASSSDDFPDLPMNEIEEHDPDVIISQTRKLKLDELDLGGLFLESWPVLKGKPVAKRVPRIVILNLSDNQFKKVPTQVFTLKRVEEFDMSNNKLSSFPDELRNFPKLQHIKLNSNPIDTLPGPVGRFNELESLELQNSSSLKAIDQYIGYFRNLTELNVSGNSKLTSLSSALGNLRNLQSFSASGCALSEIPKELFYCTRLNKVDLSANQIVAIPNDIGHLTKMSTCKFQSNALTSLPLTLLECKSLEVINVGSNPFSDPQLYGYISLGSNSVPELFKLLKQFAKSSNSKIKLEKIPEQKDLKLETEKDKAQKLPLKEASHVSPRKDDSKKARPQAAPMSGANRQRAQYKRSMRIARSGDEMKRGVEPRELRVNSSGSPMPRTRVDQPLPNNTNSSSNSKGVLKPNNTNSQAKSPLSSPKDQEKSKVALVLLVKTSIEEIKKTIFGVANSVLSARDPSQLLPFVQILKSLRAEMDKISIFCSSPDPQPSKQTDKFEKAKESILIGFKDINGNLQSLNSWFETNPPLESLILVGQVTKACKKVLEGLNAKK